MKGTKERPLVAVVMGSSSDKEVMGEAVAILDRFGIPFECKVLSAHRTPKQVGEFADSAYGRGLRFIIAGAGGAAHLPGVIAARTCVPVLGVPIPTPLMGGLDSLLSIVQMPGGVPVATFGVGKAGARNAAIFVAQILAADDVEIFAEFWGYGAMLLDDVMNRQQSELDAHIAALTKKEAK